MVSLGEPYIYQNLGCFTSVWGFYLEGVWLWRISGNNWLSILAEMRLTTLCIEGWGLGALPGGLG